MEPIAKYRGLTQQGAESLGWYRADIDGAPFRGQAPMMAEAELEQNIVKVADVHVRVFDMGLKKDRKDYATILDRVANNWYAIVSPRQFTWVMRKYRNRKTGKIKRKKTMLVHVEWSAPYMTQPVNHIDQRALDNSLGFHYEANADGKGP